MKSAIKHFVEHVADRSGVGVLTRRYRRRDVLVLAYHNVLPRGEPNSGDTSLHLSEHDFVAQLDALARTHDVVPLTSILDDAATPRRPRVAITFDDAYVGAVTVAVDALVERGMPATIFVAPGLLERYTWWDQLADPNAAAVPTETRDRYLNEFHGEGNTILAFAGKSASKPLSEAARIASEAQVSSAAQRPNITIGSHTWSHSNLQALDAPRLEDELLRSTAWLRERYTNFIPWLTYPYGLHNAMAEKAALNAGFTGALRVDGGWLRASERDARYALPRLNIPAGLSLEGFRLRINGIGVR